jgi:hypothetical protein
MRPVYGSNRDGIDDGEHVQRLEQPRTAIGVQTQQAFEKIHD